MNDPTSLGMLKYFEFSHLPTQLQAISRLFHDLAWALVDEYQLHGSELTVALRKLLEAKDCAVRAALEV